MDLTLKFLTLLETVDYIILLLEESGDKWNYSELSHIAQTLRDSIVGKHLLMHPNRCNTSTIYSTVETYLWGCEIELNTLKFAAMDSCYTKFI